ncbi:glycosyltransferase involved in cell wall biosynthesis [Ilumatobacter fluminis]|uniref:Glycosyltransferase involved in cell wall biosynthesis n=1 Tax=Ilumatobacter fluminis TaxID=467091 RepID=A0A4R7HZN1_9ACTN|nr:glycosyltransferase [Ilumatobacter fluminis]TDT15633.1 glycosyltransferase involved in cell wall biosynthesis [Ilumatobacter fluminis]
MRVAVTVGPTGYGGTATYARELVAALDRRRDVDVVALGSDDAIAELSVQPSEVIAVPARRSVEQLGVAVAARRLHDANVDVVHATRQLVPFGLRVPTVLTFHDDFALTRPDDYDRLKRVVLPPLFRRSLRHADAVVTLDARMASLATEYVPAETPVVDAGAAVPGVLASATPTSPAVRLPDRFALTVGDGNPRKGIAELLDVWPTIAETTGLPLVVAGARVATPALLERIEEEKTAVLVSQPDWGELAHLYRSATLVVDGSYDEGFGFASIEAAWAGTRFVAVRRHRSIEQGIIDALASPAPAAFVSSWDEVADRTVGVYRRLITGTPS